MAQAQAMKETGHTRRDHFVAGSATREDTIMNQRNAKRILPASTLYAAAALFIQPLQAAVIESTKQVGDMVVHYKVVLPGNYDPARAYPAVVALGGGPQTMDRVDSMLDRYFRDEAEKRGYIVIAPAAPDGEYFFDTAARIFPEFLKMIQADYKIRGDRFHIAGPSNGGISALHISAAHPQYFLSVTAFPGYMWEPNEAKLQAISKLCVFMYVGEHDPYMWHGAMKAEADFLHAQGAVARYSVEAGQPHRLETLAGANAARLFDGFDEAGKGCSK